MRIVIPALHYYPDNPSGSTRLAFDEAVFLARHGHKVWIVTQDLSRAHPECCVLDGLWVLRYPSPQLGPFDPRRSRIHQVRSRDLLQRYVGDEVDVVHGHSLLQFDGALQLYGNNTKMCYSVHSLVFAEMKETSRGMGAADRFRLLLTGCLSHRIEHRCLRRSICITAESEYTKSLLGDLHNASIQQRTQVVPGWVDLERFRIIPDRKAAKRELGWPTDVCVFFTLRRLVPRMGLDQLILALHDLKNAGHRFHMFLGGAGPLREQLSALVRELGLTECVSLIGFVPEARLPHMYAAADAFVLPTGKLECFGLIALEALACGRPVLATPVGAIPEVLNQVEDRWLAPDNTRQGIARLLADFLDGHLPSHDPLALRETISRHYSREYVLGRMTSLVLGIPETERSPFEDHVLHSQ